MRKKIILVCPACLSRNYTTFKNNDNKQDRLKLKKFCAKCSTHKIHKETK